jgi:hypothetical protein
MSLSAGKRPLARPVRGVSAVTAPEVLRRMRRAALASMPTASCRWLILPSIALADMVPAAPLSRRTDFLPSAGVLSLPP